MGVKKIIKRTGVIGSFMILGGFIFWVQHLIQLANKLEIQFLKTEPFIPVRVYSKPSRLYAGQVQSEVLQELSRRNYPFQHNQEKNQVTFSLRPPHYPSCLLPAQHPLTQTSLAQDLSVQLQFYQTESNSEPILQSPFWVEGSSWNDLYLEPELVTPLSSHDHENIRSPLNLVEVPPTLWKAVIAIEDVRFLDHRGIELRSLARALWVNLKTRSFAQGGSTLSQQLVKNLLGRRSKNIFQKINEMILTLFLESQFSKEQILERYLNEVYFGQLGPFSIHGIREGAQIFFQKNLTELNTAEMTLLAGLIRGPSFYSPHHHLKRALERQKVILKKMVEIGQIAQEEADQALSQPVRLAPKMAQNFKAPFFVDFVKAELQVVLKEIWGEEGIPHSGMKVYTSLDRRLNQIAQESLTQGLESLEQSVLTQKKAKKLATSSPDHSSFPSSDRLEGILVCVDLESGSLVSLIGGRNYQESQFNRVLNMKRQVGSLFKPIVYLAGFIKGRRPSGEPYGAGTLLLDAPWKLKLETGFFWEPKNYDRQFRGWITLRQALAESVNIPTAVLAQEIGIPSIIEVAKRVGITSPLPAVPSLALGVADLPPLEILRAYAFFAKESTPPPFHTLEALTDSEDELLWKQQPPDSLPHFDPLPAIQLLTQLLQEVVDDGTARATKKLGFPFPLAGKTGTTNQHQDAWFVGYNPRIATLVWVGYDQKTSPKISLTGAQTALPIWVEFMKHLSKKEPAWMVPFPPSPLLNKEEIDLHSGLKATPDCPTRQMSSEWWMKDLTPVQTGCLEKPPPASYDPL